jgi:hypothetical protein
LNKVGCPGNLVAVELTPKGREWSVIGEYGAVGAGGERGSASASIALALQNEVVGLEIDFDV